MSLFPAYSTEATPSSLPAEQEPQTSEWLTNSSFTIDVEGIALPFNPTNKSTPSETDVKQVKIKKRKKKKHDKEVDQKLQDSEESLIDRKRNIEFLTVKTIARPSAPHYRVNFYINSERRKHVKKKFKRYYNVVFQENDKSNSDDDANKITKADLKNPIKSEVNTNFTGFKQEDDMSQTTAHYNRSLAENPSDIDMWLKYVEFQDAIFQFEKTYRKGSIAKGLRVTAERKLCILDKALTQNPNCERLLRERLNIAVSVYPSDELQTQLKKLVEKEQGNIILWQGYIEAVQCSMSHCNTPAVLELYNKCLSTLHKLRRNSSLERPLLEENILRMLYQCGLFLKQSGLFEQLWTLLRLYLELNLSPVDKTKFNISSLFDDKQLLELEELVLKSQLPIHELWLRIEKLREACHWLPYNGENCEDPQRMVFPEDVAELIHPITMPENTFKFTATVLTLLKIPLLPCRHSTMQELGLDYVPWAVDSIESLLPIFFPIYPIDLDNKYLLCDNKLAVGPQYLKVLPGQEEYLEFALITMKNCIDCLNGTDQAAVIVWWFRFQRLLLILEKLQRCKMSQNFRKRIKNNMKNLLKQEAYRNDLVCYVEYALTEYELGSPDSALKVLLTAASITSDKSISDFKDNKEKAAFCLLHRTIVEFYVNPKSKCENGNQKALKHLVMFVVGKSVTGATDFLTQGSLNEAALKFKHTTLILLQNEPEKLSPSEHFLPNFFTDFIICNAWFIYLTKGAISCGTFLETTLDSLNDSWQKEVLFEFYVSVLFKHCIENPGSGVFRIMDDALQRALVVYPNNMCLLTVLAKELSLNYCLGQPWWKLKTLLIKTGRALPILFLVLIAEQQMAQIEEAWTDTVTGKFTML